MLLNVDEFVGSPVTKQFLAIVPEIMRQMDKFKLSIFQQSIVDNFM